MKGKKISPQLVGGALAAIIVWLLSELAALRAPPGIEVAFGVVLTMIIARFTPDAMEAEE